MLPEGMFFRVRELPFGGIEVEIRQRRKRFGSRPAPGGTAAVWPESPDTVADEIAAAKLRAVDRMNARRDVLAAYGVAAEYLGDSTE
jgi:hypothetical protein